MISDGEEVLTSRQGFGPAPSFRHGFPATLRFGILLQLQTTCLPLAASDRTTGLAAARCVVKLMLFLLPTTTSRIPTFFFSWLAWLLHDVSDRVSEEALYTHHSGPESWRGVDDGSSCLSSENFSMTTATVEAQEAAQSVKKS